MAALRQSMPKIAHKMTGTSHGYWLLLAHDLYADDIAKYLAPMPLAEPYKLAP
jgi:hypothetical protein